MRPYGPDYKWGTSDESWYNPTDPQVAEVTRVAQNIVNFKRRIMLRPLMEDNPDFNGSNPTSRTYSTSPVQFWERDANLVANPMGYRWDVDNDGDGVADSIWVDLGFPVRAAKDGKLYKPLFAILCEDMDGRLNLNAHGNLAQAGLPTETCTTFTANYFAGGTLPTITGRGFGPADINPNYVLGTLYPQILTGSTTLGYEGRYGSDKVPGSLGTPYFTDIASPLFTIDHSQRAYNDYLSANKRFEYDGIYSNSSTKQAATSMQTAPNSFFRVNGELPDPEGKSLLGVDTAGRPILQNLWGSNFLDLPYEMNLGPKASRGLQSSITAPDNPFSPDELERILRPFDRDAAQLPARLAALTSPSGSAPFSDSVLIPKRNEVTTESWDLPVFSAGLPTHILLRVQSDLMAGNITASQIPWLTPHNVTDLLKAYYYYQLVTGGTPAANAAMQANSMVNNLSAANLLELFPPEMLAGLKMNINRPFPGPGTGASNDPSSPKYDPNSFGMAALWQSLGAGGSYGDFWFGQIPDYADGTYDANNAPFAARQRYARYLYVLALLLRDKTPPPATLDPQAQWFTESLSDAKKEELTKRRIAQWAINAACFKVNDSIMVPFEYDLNPFDNDDGNPNNDTWNVDGRIGTTANPSADDTLSYRGLVWGCKPPELILTETLAFHDRRIADTAWDNGPKKKTTDSPSPDPDFDQTRVPQGSAFFELYSTRDLHGSIPPSDLYTYNSGTSTWYLDLDRLSPADSYNCQYPVWRLVISESTKKSSDNDVTTRLNNNPDSTSLETQQYRYDPRNPAIPDTTKRFSLLNNSTENNVSIDRIVWFTHTAPTTNHYDYNRIYYNQKDTSTALERGHYAVVGPREKTVLGLTSSIDSTYTKLPIGKPSNQKITLSPPNSLVITDLGGISYDSSSDVKPLLGIIVSNYINGWSTQASAGISISEPLFSSGYYPPPNFNLPGPDGVKEWYGDWQMGEPAKGYFRDHPLDIQSGMPLADDKIGFDPTTGLPNPTPSTTPNYKTVFLQRLANPLAPYDPATNPYLTVDWMPIDLTVFNGDDSIDPYDIYPPQFATRQRGNNPDNIWKPQSDDPANSSQISGPEYFKYRLMEGEGSPNAHNTLGYLNSTFGHPITSTSGDPASSIPELYGDPKQPFPWLPWFGRPYVSQMELMLVPSSHPARLLWEFQPCPTGTNNYTPVDITQAPFPQLLNFLQAGNGNGMNQFGRILDYVGVPSWFAGTEIQANPTAASAPLSAPGSHTFFPPYNSISTYREPGRINLNTIYSSDVYNGLMNNPNPSPSWYDPTQPSDFVRNRRGYGITSDNFEMDASHPTQFLKPFRSSGGSFFRDPTDITPPSEINATSMRPITPGSSKPLFQYTSAQDVNNTDRNPFFHYQGLERLGNLVTTRSNVYAVWITAGYFEVKPHKDRTDPLYPNVLPIIDAAHPDGYELGQEMGSDSGEIVRHRAFYIIDRSIPVGFQRGQDLNVEKAIILKRYIE